MGPHCRTAQDRPCTRERRSCCRARARPCLQWQPSPLQSIAAVSVPDVTWSCPEVPDIHDAVLLKRLRWILDHKTKPLGALGQLESLAAQLGLLWASEHLRLEAPQLLVFAADHGLAAQGVSAYPSAVTAQMVANFLGGGAAVSVLARQHGLTLQVVDAGVAAELAPCEGLIQRKQAWGTADASLGPAMSASQCEAALQAGADIVRECPGNVVLLGEMGIGNTSSAALLLSLLTGEDLRRCVGRGTGLDDAGVQRKLATLQSVRARHAQATTPLAALAAVGGFEIAMMVGACLQAAQERRLVVVDGFICSAAVLVAHGLRAHVLQRCVFAHRSAEHGHARMLEAMGVRALLDLDLRLGEGSAAALAWPLLESACRLFNEMASFESAGVSQATTGAP